MSLVPYFTGQKEEKSILLPKVLGQRSLYKITHEMGDIVAIIFRNTSHDI